MFRWYPDQLADSEAKAASLDAALADYFHRPGCTCSGRIGFDLEALQDDGSCGLPSSTPFPVFQYCHVLSTITPRSSNTEEWERIRNVAKTITDDMELYASIEKMFDVFSGTHPVKDNKMEWDVIRSKVSENRDTLETDPAFAFYNVVVQMGITSPKKDNKDEWGTIRSATADAESYWPFWMPACP